MDIVVRVDIYDMYHEKENEQIYLVLGMNVGMDACRVV